MITIKIDFNFDDDFVELFHKASLNEFTIVNDGKLTLETARDVLVKCQETKKFQDHERLGFLKIYRNGILVGLSMPRVITKREHKVWNLPNDKTYYRMGMIFIDEQYRGQGIAKEAALLFKKDHDNILWTIDPENKSSKKVATFIGLRHHTTLFLKGKAWKHEPWLHDRKLEIWSN